jgi:hypothetical protein
LFEREDIGGVPAEPVMLRRSRLVSAMAFLRPAEKLRQRRNVHDSGQVRPGSRSLISSSSHELPSGSLNAAYVRYERFSGSLPGSRAALFRQVKQRADFDAAADQVGARFIDVEHDEVQAQRPGRGRREPLAEVHRALGAGRRHLNDPKLVADTEVGIESPRLPASAPLLSSGGSPVHGSSCLVARALSASAALCVDEDRVSS